MTSIDDVIDRIDSLENRVEELEAENERLRAELEDERQAREDTENRVETLEGWQTGVSRWKQHVNDAIEGIQTADAGPQSDDLVGLLPIEKLAQMPDDVARTQLDTAQSRNLWRARFIWNHMDDLASIAGDSNNQKFRVTSPDMMKALKVAGESDGAVESKTTKRIMERIVDWTHGLAEIRHTSSGERALVIPTDWAERRADVVSAESGAGTPAAGGVVSGGR
ncbi:DNA binding protein [Haloferax volcanii pleomorphic virus 1]|nr:DNA binding protein [Haloferax volcanii pleomorphic virus 1]